MSSTVWKITKACETRKLSSTSGWNLDVSSLSTSPAASRSRTKRELFDFSSLGSPAPSAKKLKTIDASVVDDIDHEPSVLPSATPGAPGNKTSRVILEVDMMKGMMERHMICPKCKHAVTVTFPTSGIASGCRIDCDNKTCVFVDKETPIKADLPLPEGSIRCHRNTDYAMNILFVLSFMASGDGGKEAERLLGSLGLPRSTAMEKKAFTRIERGISGIIHKHTEEILMDTLAKAVEKHYNGRTSARHGGTLLFDLWKQQVKAPEEPILSAEEYPQLKVAADMAWQKRSSGNRYDSNSGFAVLVETELRKPVAFCVKNKICGICSHHKDVNQPIRAHDCVINHVGSAGSMEPIAILDMVVDMHRTKSVLVSQLVTDDDSSIKAKLKWSNADHMLNTNTTVKPKIFNRNGNLVARPDHGRLPREIPQPTFVADPNHRKKTLKGDLYRHLKKNVEQRCGLTRVDIMRVTTNFAYMVRTLKDLPEDKWSNCGKAVVQHHFDNHAFCGSFCRRKLLTFAEATASPKIYRCKQKDAKLYAFLERTVARFVSDEALKEVGHGSDTQVNESLNNTVSWNAPKNKTYSGSRSLSNRICLALGVHSVGTYEYYMGLFEKCGIFVSADTQHYLRTQQKTRAYRIAQCKKKEVKKARNKKLHAKLKEYSAKVQSDIAKRDGTVYQPGIGMDGGYNMPAAASASTTANTTSRVCSSCQGNDHLRPTNKKCRFYKARNNKNQPAAPVDSVPVPAPKNQLTRDADEQDLMDQVGFDDEGDEFFDCYDDEDDEDDEETGATSCII